MTERERWVVYPLLFLALGASLRDKLVDRTVAKSIVCQELTVVDEGDGREPQRVLAKIGHTEATPDTPAIGFLAVNGELAVDGTVKVNGVVNAKQYAYRGVPFTPGLQAMPSISLPALMRAIQAAQNQQKANAQKKQPQSAQPPATPSSKSGDDSPAATTEKSTSDTINQPKK